MSDFENNDGAEAQEPQIQKKKLTDMQLRIVQVVAGILSAAALIVSLFFLRPSEDTTSTSGGLLQYTFLIVFLIIMFGRRRIEAKYRLRLSLYGLVLIDGIFAGIILYVLITPQFLADSVWRTVILIGGVVLLLAFGIGWPLMRYFKRKENGTLPPIRLPEKEEPKEGEEKKEEVGGPLTTEQKIAEMMREMEQNNGKDAD
jgi:flagellar basal body-associated protein FliL